MPVNLEQLNDLAVLTNAQLQEAGPVQASIIFQYLKSVLNSLSKSRIAIAEFDTQSHWRRRNPAANSTLYNLEMPRITMTPNLKSRMVGSRTHIDASLVWEQPSSLGTYSTYWVQSGMLWHHRQSYMGTLLTLPYVYWIDGISRPDERFRTLFW